MGSVAIGRAPDTARESDRPCARNGLVASGPAQGYNQVSGLPSTHVPIREA